MIVLDELQREACRLGEGALVETFEEEPSLIAKNRRCHDEESGNARLFNLHGSKSIDTYNLRLLSSPVAATTQNLAAATDDETLYVPLSVGVESDGRLDNTLER